MFLNSIKEMNKLLRKEMFLQKQPPRGVFKKRCSENMQQITGENRRKPMLKCDFNKVAKQLLKSHFGKGALL